MAKAKKKAASKASKKAPKKAAKAGSKKAAKKAAPKKAAAKKAPKAASKAKAKPAKSAPKPPKAAKPAKVKPTKPIEAGEAGEAIAGVAAAEASDVGAGEAIEVETVAATPLRDEILALAKQLYGPRGDADLLAFDPNDLDAMDPSIFYEILEQKYGVSADPNNDYFGGFGGPIADTIKFVEGQWDGKTRNNTPLPPQDWLEEATYPDDESMKN